MRMMMRLGWEWVMGDDRAGDGVVASLACPRMMMVIVCDDGDHWLVQSGFRAAVLRSFSPLRTTCPNDGGTLDTSKQLLDGHCAARSTRGALGANA